MQVKPGDICLSSKTLYYKYLLWRSLLGRVVQFFMENQLTWKGPLTKFTKITKEVKNVIKIVKTLNTKKTSLKQRQKALIKVIRNDKNLNVMKTN